MAALNFPASPTNGQTYTANGSTWTYNSTLTAWQYTPATSVQYTSLGVGTPASGVSGEIRATNNVTGYYSSDASLKENVKDVDGALDKVYSIGAKTFDWKDSYIAEHGGEDGYFIRKSDFGVIAQDVLKVFPQAVRKREDGTLAVDYEKLGVLAFGAIRELADEIGKIKAKLD
jgi:hypothetical protein